MEERIYFLKKCAKVFSYIVFAAPLIVLLGWLIDHDTMKTLVIGSAPMNPITAILFVFVSGSYLLALPSSRSYMVVVNGFVFLIAAYRVVQFNFGLAFRIDQLLFGNAVNPMAPTAAVGFILISLSRVFYYYKHGKIVEHLLLLTVLLGGVFMVTGYVFNVSEFHTALILFPALQTCILFILLALSILLSQPDEGIIKLLVGDLEGSRVGRLFIPLTVLIPFCIGYLRLVAQRHNLISPELGIFIVIMGYVIIFFICLFAIISSLNKRDQMRNDFVTNINRLNLELKGAHDQQLAFNEELAAANEEIQAANEELSAINEQLSLAAETIRKQDQVIIEQKEEALKRSQQYLQIIFSNTKEEILLMDTEGRLVLFNNSLEDFIFKATGKKPQIGMFVWDITIPERQAESKKLFTIAVNGQPITAEVPVSTAESGVVHLLQYEPVFIDGKVNYVTLISIDITEQKRREAQLKQSESNLKAIFDNTDDSFTLLSPELKIISFNKANFNNVFKSSGKYLEPGGNILDYISPEREQSFKRLLEKVKAGEKVEYHQELATTHAWFKVSITPVHSVSGEFLGYCISSSDETAIHQAQLELRLKEERFRGLVEHSKDIFLILNKHITTYVSSTVNSVLGYSTREFTHYKFEDLVHENDLPIRWHEMEFPGASQLFEYRVKHKNGEWRWMEGFGINLSNMESLGGLVFTLRDITERKEADEKLKTQFDELKKTNYELDRFVYSVSHDLRAPLSSILGLINVAEMEKTNYELPYLGMIRGRINHLDGFIKDILDYSRNARTELQSKEIDFIHLFEETKANLKLINGFDRLNLTLQLLGKNPFYSDATRLGIIFNNLISNSIKFQDYLKPNPFLAVAIKTSEQKAEIVVSDNGIGISQEHVNKIFEMFYRASDRSKGSGLGLYIVKETVAKLNGTIKVKSNLGEFTTFEIVIPNVSP